MNFREGDEVGAGRWPHPLHGGMPPWKGKVLAVDDPRAWRGSILGNKPTVKQIRQHLEFLKDMGLSPGIPVLWDFPEGPKVFWERPEKLRPYQEDLQLWLDARMRAGLSVTR